MANPSRALRNKSKRAGGLSRKCSTRNWQAAKSSGDWQELAGRDHHNDVSCTPEPDVDCER